MGPGNNCAHVTHADRCCTAVQVLLLLKSSDRVAHDICHAFDSCETAPSGPVQHVLALRKWIALRPERELRCFVRQRELIGGPSACTATLAPVVKARGCDCLDPRQAARLLLHSLGSVCLTAPSDLVHAHMTGHAIRQRTLPLS